MPVKLRHPKQREHRITPEAIAAWRAGNWMALQRALGLRPWQVNPLDADEPEPPHDRPGGPWRDSWPLARALRGKLEAASLSNG